MLISYELREDGNMRYRHVMAFRYVMITGTATAAADAMSITQPAVSRLIAELEEDLSFRLFDRYKRRLRPTSEAIRFYQGVEKFFMGLDQLDRLAEQIRRQQPADLKVCATPALATCLFPEVVRRFTELHPVVNIFIEGFDSSEIVLRLQTHLTHLAATQAFPETSGIVQEPLMKAFHVCALHESHALAKKEVIEASDLVGENVLAILPTGLVDWRPVGEVLAEAGVTYDEGIGISNSHTGYSLIAANLAVAVIEPFAASTWLQNGVVVRPFEPKISFEYVIAYSLAQQQTDHMKQFAAIIREICTQAGWPPGLS